MPMLKTGFHVARPIHRFRSAVLILCLLLTPAAVIAQQLTAPPATSKEAQHDQGIQDETSARIILVEWSIKKGQEREFLDYWSTRATVEDRAGLIGEFLSRVE